MFRRNRLTVGLIAVPAIGLAVAMILMGIARLRPADNVALIEPTAGPSATSSSSSTPSPSASATPGGVGRLGAKPSASATSAPADSEPPSRSGFPNAGNTGVPSGTSLKAYSGSCTITKANTVIEAKTIKCDIAVKAKNVVIKKSRINGQIISEGSGSVRIEDSEIDGGTGQTHTVAFENITVLRTEIRGGQTNVNCRSNCLIQDSWLHAQYMPDGEDWHLDAFLSNGGSNIRLIHNTLACDHPGNSSGGCSANAAIFGDFSANSNYTFDRNLFVASENTPYCAYGGMDTKKPYGTQVQGIVFTNNVFQRGKNGKCGTYGPITSFDGSKSGNVWRNNVWDDGKPVPPAL
ncbi:hypothetical protein [Phytohabitans rumicis]|uniref:Right handed beta helix domain-containing protein n=1 Tax=Phytohabitans rumicis TaxID=1076125 RepID=A0A6V8KW33_9ACTN|nr:hypothetical protein [Phytohabitans rumicis]GFJ89293.1 hypothetical protein Prum_029350 [Phytohabitans rumicis]